MRIAFVINTMARGGAEIQVKDYALRMKAQGHDVLLVSLLPFEEFQDELRRSGVVTETLGMTKGQGSVAALGHLVRILRGFRPDVVHAHMFAAIIASRLARAALLAFRVVGVRVPALVETAHAPFEASHKRYVAYRVTEPLSDLWTCVCQEGVDEHERHRAVRPGRGVVTANGIDVKAFAPDAQLRADKRRELGIGDDELLVLTAGSFRDEQKDYSNLLAGFAQVRADVPSARLLIAGTGALFEQKKAEAVRLGLGDSVRFLGLRNDVGALLRAADVFVLGSAWEAMPIALLEAAASGLPIVCTNVGQNADLVVEGSGHVVPPKDPARLAEALGAVLRAPAAERRAMGERSRAHVSARYDLDAVVEQWHRRYEGLMASRTALS